MSGPGTWRLLGPPRPGKSIGRGFEIVLGFSLLSFYMGFTDLSGFRQGSAFTTASNLDYLWMAAPCVYGLRVARFIAIARKYRMPQYLEWLVFVVPLIVLAVCAVGSPYFIQIYARDHGYRFCGPRPDHGMVYVFAKPMAKCPFVPFGAR